ncbi:DUF2975 domain-containing protein [Rhodoplanes sp. TEM]|uniref:DUF2975 domain-containing protein n=1 Tax=Rhodoplanes tepidamans TaxID=200616 RepID=A0ABT5JAS6_RHOTP|nr:MULTISPECIES: DUF2975 domain-containing protein [Rhodoplanes]MDC7786752.1 DUF2975 domain-containing protein [Rhodoplanes tepidamans]MDC7983758.1 DUF2975 domain-containing protein [Rhodoplanes sp. TEM]MDQ0358189.1 hypothetical protein [Rhodoplanes tepidamans]
MSWSSPLADDAAVASSQARLARLSRRMAWVTTVGIVLIIVLMGLAFAIPDWSRNLLLNRLGATGAKLPLGPAEQAALAAIYAVPIGVMVWGLWHVRALFRDFAIGRVFTADAAERLRRFGLSVLLQGPLGPLTATALALALSLGNPPGQRYLVLTVSINDYVALIVGGVLVAIAAVMREATRLADENAAFV